MGAGSTALQAVIVLVAVVVAAVLYGSSFAVQHAAQIANLGRKVGKKGKQE